MTSIPFSVIMPVYKGDRPDHFYEALKSIEDQTLRANEVVIIQDGPVLPEHLEVLEEFKGRMPELNHVILKENQGLSGALNAGVDAARYNWLARMDADDICRKDRFEKQMDYIERHPELHLLGSWIEEYDENMEAFLGVRKLPETHSQILHYARWRCPFNHMTILYRKDTLVKLGKYKNYGAVGDDYELWARFLVNGYQTANVQENLVKARTGMAFFGTRRRGMKYLKNEMREINDLKRLGLINGFQWMIHALVKSVVRLSPSWLVKGVYRMLRKSS
ncbi:MAG: glycosyltransferase [Bacteroidota bacterium]|nr:glycosyltransferase [Bacteroidota bacterium]MDX5447582.1 glycosyltransferase [Bacteroidota bacterium]MDX5505100.1 glycosyltransferase [Bacteroidota bacterium]